MSHSDELVHLVRNGRYPHVIARDGGQIVRQTQVLVDVTCGLCLGLAGAFLSNDHQPDEREQLLASISRSLHDVYDPAVVLMFWSARIKYLDDRRPCDLMNDLDALRTLDQRANALADGAFA
jgi:hypothetical protein